MLLALRLDGVKVGKGRVQRLMNEMGLTAQAPRRRWSSAVPGHRLFVYHVRYRFSPADPDRLWVADANHLKTSEGPLYLAAVMNSASHRIVGWAFSRFQTAELMCDALTMGRVVDCYDNAPMESWFASLKKECVFPLPMLDRAEVQQRAVRWIES